MLGTIVVVAVLAVLVFGAVGWWVNRHPATRKMHNRWFFGALAVVALLLVLYLLGSK
ncbi:hypothetical protein [Fodinicola acaciae]|uniref:hypothetical protein n=1 Tax=Fodinicola acaciae TaxID=2681555 RepID=UPI0013D108AC|nr:hypothetical protein [Fodinicola acaciae]